jgi:signal transduction histidine kinase
MPGDAPGAPRRYLLSVMPFLISAWPALAPLLPALVLVSALYFLAKGDRRALWHLMALLACFLIGALLMEFFLFMGARMARTGSREAVLGMGTLQLLKTMASPRSIAAPPLSLAAVAAYSVLAAYLWLVVTWAMHLRGKRAGGDKRKKPAKGARKARA